ncbi:MAG: outer membrane lipid asymmetry maintenance protein MlaD [Alphaproteobacteria bacterium]|nr:outer membrane lipid asymmetry maintenance protein MlaD [Alphaproteobacteria bacterium]
MKRSVVETVLGAVVILAAVLFLTLSYDKSDLSAGGGSGYEITANFSGIGGLKPGDDVQISGVKVGYVTAVELDDSTYLARVRMNVSSGIKLPSDTAALISSESLLGGKYLALEPGADEEYISAGGVIEYTQAPQNLEQLLGQFIFSMQDSEKKKEDESAALSPKAGDENAKTPELPSPRPSFSGPGTMELVPNTPAEEDSKNSDAPENEDSVDAAQE